MSLRVVVLLKNEFWVWAVLTLCQYGMRTDTVSVSVYTSIYLCGNISNNKTNQNKWCTHMKRVCLHRLLRNSKNRYNNYFLHLTLWYFFTYKITMQINMSIHRDYFSISFKKFTQSILRFWHEKWDGKFPGKSTTKQHLPSNFQYRKKNIYTRRIVCK